MEKELCYVNYEKNEITLEDKSVINANDVKATWLGSHFIACFKGDDVVYLIVKENDKCFRRYNISCLFEKQKEKEEDTLEKELWNILGGEK